MDDGFFEVIVEVGDEVVGGIVGEVGCSGGDLSECEVGFVD